MHAAVITAFGQAPTWQEFPEPIPAEDEVLVDVVAAGLHPRVRSQADGSHYTSVGALPLVPGVDGVGREPAQPPTAPTRTPSRTSGGMSRTQGGVTVRGMAASRGRGHPL